MTRQLSARLTIYALALLIIFVSATAPEHDGVRPAGWGSRIVRAASTTITVTTTQDELDGDTSSFEALIENPGGAGISLREAITAANATPPGPRLLIHFAIPDTDPGYETGLQIWRIRPGPSALPPFVRGNVSIDGTTQPGAGLVSYPVILLDGTDVYEGDRGLNGLTITSSGNIIHGIAVVMFWDVGVLIEGAAASNNVVTGCFIGVPMPDDDPQPNYYGIDIRNGAHDNLIGGNQAADRNIISGNDFAGVRIDGSDTMSNTVAGNWIGIDADGTRALANAYYGVVVSGGAQYNLIGGGNVISGNNYGIMVMGTNNNRMIGNLIGLAPNGSSPIGNRDGGVFLVDGASKNVVGGETATERNIIAGNGYGIFVGHYYTESPPIARWNHIKGNYIGVDATGILPRGNMRQGIFLTEFAASNILAGNVVTYNGWGGMTIEGADNRIASNLIGVGADGTTSLGNQKQGTLIIGDNNIVGPSNTFAYNQLSGLLIEGDNAFVYENAIYHNDRSGVCIKGDGVTLMSNTVTINHGVEAPWDDFDAQSDDCSLVGGVVLTDTQQTLIQSNTIRDNAAPGVIIYGGERNRLASNSITTNSESGIVLLNGANRGIPAPTILTVKPTEVRGIACHGCYVEIFADPDSQGHEFLGAVHASGDDGTFSLAIRGNTPATLRITATSTDADGNTSAFAVGVGMTSSPPTYAIHLPLVVR
ncbi:MAG: right-handed parallel beta-helix repeat-containing protein [Roseiflexus sp.]